MKKFECLLIKTSLSRFSLPKKETTKNPAEPGYALVVIEEILLENQDRNSLPKEGEEIQLSFSCELMLTPKERKVKKEFWLEVNSEMSLDPVTAIVQEIVTKEKGENLEVLIKVSESFIELELE